MNEVKLRENGFYPQTDHLYTQQSIHVIRDTQTNSTSKTWIRFCRLPITATQSYNMCVYIEAHAIGCVQKQENSQLYFTNGNNI